MKRHVIGAVLIAALAPLAESAAQERQPTAGRRAMIDIEKAQTLGKLRGAVEMRTTRGAPYYGEAMTEFVQTLPDGNRIARKTIVRIYRDSEGRVRRENVTADGARVESVTIVDPVAGTHVLLEPDTKTAHAARPRTFAYPREDTVLREEDRKKAAELDAAKRADMDAPPPPPPAPMMGVKMRSRRPDGGLEQVNRQDLGQRTIDGLTARGTRTTTVIPAGAIGNDQSIRIVSEEWFSPDLQVLVSTRHSDPRTGETTYTLANIVRAEPSRSLFEIPADYTRK